MTIPPTPPEQPPRNALPATPPLAGPALLPAAPANPLTVPPPARKNAATQHLCAAAYIDREFRNAVFDEVYDRADRAIAPNPGTDAVPILRHMRKARRIDATQQGLLALMLLLLICMPTVSKVQLFIGLAVWALVGVPALLAESRSGTPTGSISAVPLSRLGGGRIALMALLSLIAAALLVAVLPELTAALLGDAAGGSYASDRGTTNPATVFGWLLVLAAVSGICGAARAASLMSVPTEPESSGRVDERTRFIGLAQRSPVVTYNANRSPFVGSGFTLATWQLAMTLRPADAATGVGSPMTVDPVDLNRSVKSRIEQLGADTAITKRLPGLELTDHVYVSGRNTAAPVFHAYELRRSGYPFETVEQVQADPTTPVRHYLRCTIDSWSGELVTTVLLHCALQGETLYIEFTSCVLPPTPERYHVYDGTSKSHAVLLGFARGIAAMPVELLRSPFDAIREFSRGTGGSSQSGTTVGAGDHGAVAGVRELGTDIAEQNYFQYRDSVKYIEILERQIFDALLDYLRASNVDVSELDERANTIVNNGVINYGKFQAGAAGAGSSANVGSVGDASRGNASGSSK